MPFCEAVFQINEHARRHIILVDAAHYSLITCCPPFMPVTMPALAVIAMTMLSFHASVAISFS